MNSQPLLQQLVNALQCLPGVGKKSAQRMAFHLLDKDRTGATELGNMLQKVMQEVGNCQSCRDYTENEICSICANDQRDNSVICVIESPADVAAIEATAAYSGKYFVLMGSLSPLDGIGPEEIGLDLLRHRLGQGECREVIIATSATIEGEATAHFIKNIVDSVDKKIIVSRLAQGVPIGGELEYLDASTVSLSLANRLSI